MSIILNRRDSILENLGKGFLIEKRNKLLIRSKLGCITLLKNEVILFGTAADKHSGLRKTELLSLLEECKSDLSSIENSRKKSISETIKHLGCHQREKIIKKEEIFHQTEYSVLKTKTNPMLQKINNLRELEKRYKEEKLSIEKNVRRQCLQMKHLKYCLENAKIRKCRGDALDFLKRIVLLQKEIIINLEKIESCLSIWKKRIKMRHEESISLQKLLISEGQRMQSLQSTYSS